VSLNEFINELSEQGIALVVDGKQLKIRARQGVLTPTLKDRIAARKSELLDLLKERGAATSLESLPQIVPDHVDVNKPFPLTDIQHAYWIGRGDSLELGNIAVHAYMEIEHDELDIERLARAWRALVQRHDMLRMIINPDGGQQVLSSVPEYEIKLINLSGKDITAAEHSLRRTREAMSHQILSTDEWPLFDIRATQYENHKVRLHISLDILMADLWSLFRLFSEWRVLYDNPSEILPKLELSFRDYVLAEQSLEDEPFFQSSRDYWLARLDELHPAPELPMARRPSDISRPKFVRHSHEIEKSEWERLQKIAAASGITPSGLLLSAFSEVLVRWSRHPRFTLNLTLFNRLPLHPQVNQIVGDFTSTILLSIDNSGDSSFEERASRIQKQLYSDLEHRAFNGVRVLRELAQRRAGIPNAAMPVVFSSALGLGAVEKGAVDTRLGGQLGDVIYTITQTPQVWLDHQVFEYRGALRFNWDVVEALFPSGMIDAMFATYCDLLRNLANQPEAWKAEQAIDLRESQHLRRAQINNTGSERSSAMLHELVQDQARSNPTVEAVVSCNRRLTYSELAIESCRLARKVRSFGVQPNSLVAIVLNKGWEQVVAVLGALTSGAAYLPVDPELPDARRKHLLNHGEVSLVITDTDLGNRLAWPEGVTTVCIDDPSLANESGGPLDNRQKQDDLAYVIYTSGSTGEPKGVMIQHSAVVNTVQDINSRYDVTSDDRALAVSALSFDLSVYDIFGPLAVGGTVVIPDIDAIRDPAQWWQLIRKERITLWNSVPALFQMLIDYLAGSGKDSACHLRLAMLSGDWIPLELPGRAHELWKSLQIISQGGATEASIWSIFYPVEKVDPNWQSVPYGTPLANQQFYILNDKLEACPDWVAGQLYIAGAGLAQGYWRDEKKTKASFVTHPVSRQRLYRTGDIGRYYPDGVIEFLGREDSQVKVNGYRIELGEIETVLGQNAEVKDVVVSVFGERLGDKRLVAYVVPVSTYRELTEQPHDFDPLKKLEFKIDQKGLRSDREQHQYIDLGNALDEIGQHAHIARQSYRHFSSETIKLTQIGGVLSGLSQLHLEDAPLPKYRYPSAGGLYPVQTYLYVKRNRVEGLDGGVYYYDPETHSLVYLSGLNGSTPGVFAGINQPVADAAAFALFSISRPDAINPLYGELSRDFCLLEAGYMGQIVMQSSPEHSVGLCPIGQLDFKSIAELFKLDEDQELLQAFVGGAITAEDQTHWGVDSTPVSEEERLLSYLRERLPAYMVPSTLVMLEHMPLTSNGKIERRALPEPIQVNADADATDLPCSPEEKRVSELFAQCLKQDAVGNKGSFFELGGDSLLATRLVGAICKEFSVDYQLRDLFQGPTVADVAARLVELGVSSDGSGGELDGVVQEHEEGEL